MRRRQESKRRVPPASGISEQESRAWAAATAVLDRVAADAERRWGVGRLPTLVPADLAARFAMAEQQCDEAISSGDVELAAQKAAALARGWGALEQAARAAGHTEADTGVVWCVEVEGQAYAVCLHLGDVGAVAAKFHDHRAVSVIELLRLLTATEAGRLISAVKDTFPGAVMNNVVPLVAKKPEPDWSRGDDLPF